MSCKSLTNVYQFGMSRQYLKKCTKFDLHELV